MQTPLHSLVCVEWLDACSSSGWHAMPSEGDPPVIEHQAMLCRTYGVLIQVNEDHIVVAQTVGVKDDADVGGLWSLPKGMIRRIEVLREGVFALDAASNVWTMPVGSA